MNKVKINRNFLLPLTLQNRQRNHKETVILDSVKK